ncbi:MAG: M28 family peptidase [Flavobacteriaceae bacterium]|nr:M28 family peptidase [Flavobacteriaceae bacterium]
MKLVRGIISFLLLILFLYFSFYTLMPPSGKSADVDLTEFSVERALVPLKEISKQPHYHGSQDHARVRAYLADQLEQLGLTVEVQEGYVLNTNYRRLTRPKNIVARLKGTESDRALLLLSHYDSAKVPSFGASDAGSGVVTILEGLRAYLTEGKIPKNDIIILFSDAEEIGLVGAKLFVREHPWAEDVGLVLNFESRGSGGPSNMILETNQGNANLIKGFVEAAPEYPMASSLMYSIYKMLPNDTDSTVFREEGDIDSFFFAFIDDHFDYHTANDTYENLDRNTLQHQGSYLLPLLHYFGDANLSELKADTDHVYVNFPFLKMITYPFSWIPWMALLAVLLYIALIIYGISQGRLRLNFIAKGFVAFLSPLVITGLIGYFGWMFIMWLYPHYADIQHGFTYNGHWYITFFVILSLGFCFLSYSILGRKKELVNFYVAPLTIWLLLCVAVSFYLKGAAYFILPLFIGFISFGLMIRQTKPNLLLLTLLSAPALFLFAPLIQSFPVGLGLKMLFISCVFTVLLFGLILPVIGRYSSKNLWMLACFSIALVFFLIAHGKSAFSETRQKPNSLIYYLNADQQKAYWLTFDSQLDPWTRSKLGNAPEKASNYIKHAAGSKYNLGYTYGTKAPLKDIEPLQMQIIKDTIIGEERSMVVSWKPQRNIHEVSVYTTTSTKFSNLKINGKDALSNDDSSFNNRNSDFLIQYFIADNDSLTLEFTVPKRTDLSFKMMQTSYDLLSQPEFSIDNRPIETMPKPFVNTDAILIESTYDLTQEQSESISSDNTTTDE